MSPPFDRVSVRARAVGGNGGDEMKGIAQWFKIRMLWESRVRRKFVSSFRAREGLYHFRWI